MTRDRVMQQVHEAARILRAQGAQEVYLFGSLVEGDWHSESDVDLAVEGLPSHLFFAATAKAADVVDRPLDVVSLDQHTPFTEYLVQRGNLHRVG